MLNARQGSTFPIGAYGRGMNQEIKTGMSAGAAALLAPESSKQTSAIQRIDVKTLLGAQRELILVLQDSEYRLRLTSKGKLILTK